VDVTARTALPSVCRIACLAPRQRPPQWTHHA
jgi:hypothetical protein